MSTIKNINSFIKPYIELNNTNYFNVTCDIIEKHNTKNTYVVIKDDDIKIVFDNYIIDLYEFDGFNQNHIKNTNGFSYFSFLCENIKDNLESYLSLGDTVLVFDIIRDKAIGRKDIKQFDLILLFIADLISFEYSGFKVVDLDYNNVRKSETWIYDLLQVKEPNIIYTGTINDYYKLKDTCFSAYLNNSYPNNDYDMKLAMLKKSLIDYEKTYTDNYHSVVFVFDKMDNNIYGIKNISRKIRDSYINPVDRIEQKYWLDISELTKDLCYNYEDILDISEKIKKISYDISSISESDDFPIHSLKNKYTTEDELLVSCKLFINKHMDGHNGSLLIGKFNIWHNGHQKLYEIANGMSDYVFIDIIKTASSTVPLELSQKMIESCMIDKVVTSKGANLRNITKGIQYNINALYVGDNRKAVFEDQCNKLGIELFTIERDNESINKQLYDSLKNNDIDAFELLTPEPIWTYFDKLKEFIK